MAIDRINAENSNINEEEQRLNDILSSINGHNQGFTDDQNRRLREAELKKEAEEREERNKRLQEQFRLRHEKEAENKRLREDAEYQAKIELLKKQEKNPFNSIIKKVRAEKNELDKENSEKDTMLTLLVANVLERTGGLYVRIREWFIMKRRVIGNKIIRLLAKTIGFAIPELPESLDAEEERIRLKKEVKKMKKEEAKQSKLEKKKEKETKTREKKENAHIASSPDDVAAQNVVDKEESLPSEPPIPQIPIGTTSLPETDCDATIVPKGAFDPSTLSDEEWDEHLDEDYRELKEDIVYAHTTPTFRSTERAITDIQNEESVLAVLVSSKDMNDLFIFSDKEMFIDLVTDRLNFSVDYTYIYVITPTASMYYGSDTCYHKLTVVFDNIRMLILRGRKFFDEKALKSIEGINMFRNIYIS